MAKLIYCSTTDYKEARTIAQTILNEKLVACVNIMPAVESLYRWKGTIENQKEAIMIIKTIDEKVTDTIKRIHELHSYDVPEIIVLPLVDGLPVYFDFLQKETL